MTSLTLFMASLGDMTQRWWALLTLAAVHWRLGNPAEASRFITLVQTLRHSMTKLQLAALGKCSTMTSLTPLL